MSNLPESTSVATEPPFDVIVERGGFVSTFPLWKIGKARIASQKYSDIIRRRQGLPIPYSASHIQYRCVTPDVIRHEELFDHRATQQVVDLLRVKHSIQDVIREYLVIALTGEGEMTLARTYELLYELDSKDRLEYVSLRRLYVPAVQEYLNSRLREDFYCEVSV